MKCIVTAGPTFEPLDQVRRLTNLSTGRLGTELASHLAERGHEVILLKGAASTFAGSCAGAEQRTFTTTADLRQQLEALATPRMGAVFHAAAVSDFRFGKVYERGQGGELIEVRAGKLPSRGRSLLVELAPTPKIIARLRDWFPRARLIGWKYEVDGSWVEATNQGWKQMKRNRMDACVVNGPAYGPGFGILYRQEHCAVTDHAALYPRLAALLKLLAPGRVRQS